MGSFDWHEYQQQVGQLEFGKKLPTAVYVYRDTAISLGAALDRLIAQVSVAFQIGPEFNLIKFRAHELKVSFLNYPQFFEDPHPALRQAITIDLVREKARHTDYGDNLNPPILHRKETFLPVEHPLWATFRALTEAEEAAGLYDHSATIGFKLNWEKLLKTKGLVIRNHRLEPGVSEAVIGTDVGGDRVVQAACSVVSGGQNIGTGTGGPGDTVAVARHKTAMTRYELSKPVKSLLEYGVLRSGMSFFDYGCGQGSDVKGLSPRASIGSRSERVMVATGFNPWMFGIRN